MLKLTCTILKFEKQAEKTGWMYILIPHDKARLIHPNDKKSFRIKGTMDSLELLQVAVIPMGEGDYILPINAEMRKTIRKSQGESVMLSIEVDNTEFIISPDLMICLQEENQALTFFNSLSSSHQRYFSKWIESANTIETKTDRVMKTIYGLQHRMDYGMMIRHFQKK